MLALFVLASTLAAQAGDRVPMSAGLRSRSLTVPDGILNTWYFTADEGALQERPHLGARVYGVEFSLEPAPTVYTFYLEYLGVRAEDGYWDDRDSPPVHDDGDWLANDGLGAVVLGANFGHEVTLSSQDKTAWLGLLVGGGLGAGLSVGRAEQWKAGPAVTTDPARCGALETAIDRKDHCDPDENPGLWPVVPMVDISVALRLHVADRAYLRLEGGLHDTLYGGLAAGGSF